MGAAVAKLTEGYEVGGPEARAAGFDWNNVVGFPQGLSGIEPGHTEIGVDYSGGMALIFVPVPEMANFHEEFGAQAAGLANAIIAVQQG